MGEIVTFPANGRSASGYLARAASSGAAGVVVIQEWWGLNDHIKDIADRFATAGYTALAPDLFHGVTTTEPDEGEKLQMALNIGEAAKDMRGAILYLRDLTSSAVGIVGFCMGGMLSLFAACDNPDSVAACVDFYGVHPAAKPNLAALTAPLLGIFAARDDFTPPAVVEQLDRQLAELGKVHDFTIYPDVDHAFFNDARPEVYNAEAAEDAWRKVLAFYKQHLQEWR